MPVDTTPVLEAARRARVNAYAPYSGFAVGAALLDDRGVVHTGANVENASYGLTMCAEQVALASAVAAGVRSFTAIAIIGPRDDEVCMPCGRCRQLLHEFAPDLDVVVSDGGDSRVISLRTLLPEAFGPSTLSGSEYE